MKITYNKLRRAAVLYCVFPVVIFLFGWISTVFACLFTMFIAGGLFIMVRNSDEDDGNVPYMQISKKAVIFIAVAAVIWCILAGQGGFISQTKDHEIRNAIFHDLIKMDWPVIYDQDQMLSYYIAHWMFPALAGKAVLALSGSVFYGYLAGNIALLIWSSIGCFIALMLTAMVTASKDKSHPVAAAVMFIMFSGLDVVGKYLTGFKRVDHIEWWANYFQFSSISTCLFWVYNQAIVSWIITLCLINEKKIKNFALLGILVLPFGPFPFIGIVMMCIIKACEITIKRIRSKMKTAEILRDIFSVSNIAMLIGTGIPYAAYYMSNAIVSNDAVYDESKVNVGLRFLDSFVDIIYSRDLNRIVLFFAVYVSFIFLESGIFILLIAAYRKKKIFDNMTFIILSELLLFIPLMQMGSQFDFGMRVSIPMIIYIYVEFTKMVTQMLPSKGEFRTFDSLIKAKPLLIISLFVFLLGTVTPLTEAARGVFDTISLGVHPKTDYFFNESLNDVYEKNNFASSNYTESAFYKYLCRK
ncbi:MAG: hypothetical protein Q4F95_08715 [Oscillospiraceae bacterium]|nr:hypothetical protein [Oscillospiraceae bacterium]